MMAGLAADFCTIGLLSSSAYGTILFQSMLVFLLSNQDGVSLFLVSLLWFYQPILVLSFSCPSISNSL
jgi:hypothetical protein